MGYYPIKCVHCMRSVAMDERCVKMVPEEVKTFNSRLDGSQPIVVLNNNKKNKQIFLTEEGKDMTNRLIVPVIEAEKLSFDAFDIQELKKMFRLSFEHVKQLEKLVGKISDNSKGEDE